MIVCVCVCVCSTKYVPFKVCVSFNKNVRESFRKSVSVCLCESSKMYCVLCVTSGKVVAGETSLIVVMVCAGSLTLLRPVGSVRD